MILSYNSRLKPMHEKGKCGDPEICDSEEELTKKVKKLAQLILDSAHTVVFTGAGISTSCGIADFRGPTGVWTNELRGISLEPAKDTSECFDKALPSFTHISLYSLLKESRIHHIVSQNVDGLHMRSGVLADSWLTELHGNIFIEECVECGTQYFRSRDVGGMGLKPTGSRCDNVSCSGALIDNAVDWDTDLPEHKFKVAEQHMSKANLVICLGTSLRIRPAGNMPTRVLRKSSTRDCSKGDTGNLVIVNLQSTHLDKRASIKINGYCDDVMRRLCDVLNVIVTPMEPILSCTLSSTGRNRKRRKLLKSKGQPNNTEFDRFDYSEYNTSSKRTRIDSGSVARTAEPEATRRSARIAEGFYWRDDS